MILLRWQNHLFRASAVSSKKPRARQKAMKAARPLLWANEIGTLERNKPS